MQPSRFVLPAAAVALAAGAAAAQVHFTYLWHMEQPIYWPDQQVGGTDRYERAWESQQRKNAGRFNPTNNLNDIFGKPDRVAAYQWRVKDSIDAFDWAPEAGVQVSYSGGLIENLQSLGGAFQLGYSPNWFSDYRTARSWSTTGGKPRADIVIFPFHHPLSPLVAESTLRKEIQLYKAVYDDAWGTARPMSRGFFPSEMAFSTRMIRVLDQEGVDWSFVSGEKISRACADYPVVLGSGGVNCDPPNRADMVNPAQGNYVRYQISRGCAPAEAVPLAFTPQRAQSVDPATGQVYEIIVVPCAQGISWEDGYNPIGPARFNELAAAAPNPSRPMLTTLAHDGDNAFAGGFSYYMEATPNLVSQAQAAGHVASTVEQYLADHPVPANAVVHVEDGAWVNADGDFGSPQFWNWNYPPVNAQGQVDIKNGWAEDIRNWAVITAAQNHVDTAEQIWTGTGGTVDVNEILYPGSGTNPVERAWHFFLGGLNSGYMYYGTAEDFEVKPTIASNEALEHTAAVIGDASQDATGPAVWLPQRWPWNPGEVNFGAAYGYQATVMPTDVTVWTFVHDVSDTQAVTLKYRVDNDGINPLSSTQNETYAGGGEVGAWQSIEMTRRAFPAGNVYSDPTIDFFEMPQQIADQYYADISGLSDTLIDYYVEAVDTKGNVTRSDIQHVWIGDGEGATGGGGGDRVVVMPEPAVAGEPVTVEYDAAGGPLAGAGSVNMYWGVNGWAPVVGDVAMVPLAGGTSFTATVTPPGGSTVMNFVFNDGAGTWDNNNGQDWSAPLDPGAPIDTWTIDGQLDGDAVQVVTGSGVGLYAGVKGDVLYLATDAAGGGADRFVLLAGPSGPGAMQPAMWGKGGQVAAWDAFVGNEESNGFNGWFDQSPAAASSAAGGVLEATIDLAARFGAMPDRVFVAAASYGTSDGGALQPASQLPATTDADALLDAGEYTEVLICALLGTCCPADLTTTGNASGVPDGVVDLSDFSFYLGAWSEGDAVADFTTTGTASGVPDGVVDLSDFSFYLGLWSSGCP